jgi:hypothetical protein
VSLPVRIRPPKSDVDYLGGGHAHLNPDFADSVNGNFEFGALELDIQAADSRLPGLSRR